MPPKGDRIGGGGTRKTTWESNRMLSYCFVVFMLIRLRLRLLLLLRETKREITGAHGRSSGRSREIKREVTGGHGRSREITGDQAGGHGRSSGRSREIRREITGDHGRSREIKREITGDQTGGHGRSREHKIAHHSGQTPFFHLFWVPRKV